MKKLYLGLIAAVIVALTIWACSFPIPPNPLEVVVYAQSLPATVHATWTPSVADATHGPASAYVVTTDGTAQTVLSTACTPTLCTATITVNSWGKHTTTIAGQNQLLDTDPTSTQLSTVVTAPGWTLLQGPNSPINPAVKQ